MSIIFLLLDKSNSLIYLCHYQLMMILIKFSPLSAKQHQDNNSQDHRTHKTLLYLSHHIWLPLSSLLQFLLLCRALLLSKTFLVPALNSLLQLSHRFLYQQGGPPEVTNSLLICRTMSALIHRHLGVIWSHF